MWQSLIVLIYMAVAIPVVYKWRLYKSAGVTLVGMYVGFQVFFVLTEEHVILSHGRSIRP